VDGHFRAHLELAGDLGVSGAGDLPLFLPFLDDDLAIGHFEDGSGDLVVIDGGSSGGAEAEGGGEGEGEDA